MESTGATGALIISAAVGRHLAFAPVGFAVTDGPAHTLVYANNVFQGLQSAGEIGIGQGTQAPQSTADLTPLLDKVFRSGKTERDVIVQPSDVLAVPRSCTVWPVTDSDGLSERLVVEVRDVELIEGARLRQKAITERLLLSALRDQDLARDAVSATDRAQYLAEASRDLAVSLDEAATQERVRRMVLPRPGTWCIVDVLESNGAIRRLAVVHPDPAKQELARQLTDQWPSKNGALDASTVPPRRLPVVVTEGSGAALMQAARGEENLRVLREIGFGALLVVPLIVRTRVQGAMTFVTPKGDPPFTSTEIRLALDVGARCALALDNARMYREADALRLAAELANQSKGQFLGRMSHELRTPLNAIAGFTELIDMGTRGPVTEGQHVALARIKANQKHLVVMISEILDFVRIESGRMEYVNAPVSMVLAASDTLEMLGPAISAKGMSAVIAPCVGSPEAWADPDRVRQILVNLVMNAVKYTSGNGGTITLSCATVGETVVAEVADTGPGIPVEKLNTIFEPFEQLTTSLSDRQGGVGLGLAISRDMARGMSGDLTVASGVGVGSHFKLTLPLARDGAPASVQPAHA
jgi:signal transduction histidine kinase